MKTLAALTLAALLSAPGIAAAQAVTVGVTTIGPTIDTGDSTHLNASRVTTPSVAGAIVSISAYVGPLDTLVANQQFQLAIYSDASGRPGALLGSTATGLLVANAWNTLPLALPLQPLTSYWLIYNANGRTAAVDNLAMSTTGTSAFSIANVAFGTWPNAPAVTLATGAFSLYATFATTTTTAIPVTSTSQLQWDQQASSLSEAQGLVYAATIDVGTPVALPTTCVAGVPNAICTAAMPGMIAGQHDIAVTAAAGGALSALSNKVTVLMQVTAAPTTTTLAMTRTLTTATLTATVTSPLGGTPTGTVIFKDAGVQIASAALVGGIATWTTTSFTFGSHLVTAEYQGSPTSAISASVGLAFTVDIVAPTNLRVVP